MDKYTFIDKCSEIDVPYHVPILKWMVIEVISGFE